MCKHCVELEDRLKDLKARHYQEDFGDDLLCICGHPYYRHFESWDENLPVWCKYCSCYNFIKKETP